MGKRSILKITGGRFRGQQIRVIDLADLRPTSSKIRQAIFSMLGDRLQGSFLDACGGSGIMALEALSRGANPVVISEVRANTCRLIESNIMTFRPDISIRRCNGKKAISSQRWSKIFLDPPYRDSPTEWLPLAIQHADEVVIYEHSVQKTTPEIQDNWRRTKHRIYGNTAISIYEPE